MYRFVLSMIQDLLGGLPRGPLKDEDALEVGQLRLAPLPVPIWMDSGLPMGSRGDLQVSRMIWVAPPSGGHPPKKLLALFYPN